MSTPLLICDDSTMSRKMIMKALPPNWEVEITQASNGLEAMAAIRAGKADVVFLDLTMPEMDGYQVLEALQHEPIHPKVFVISADVQPEALERVRQLGALDFVKKPIDSANLVKVLTEHGVL